MSKRVVVTGATGFIGRNIAEDLCREGVEVFATGRDAEIGRILEDAGITFTQADLRNTGQVAEAFRPADCVIHCGGKSADWGRATEFFDVNVEGTRNVIRACRKHAIPRIIFVSTPSIYFTGSDRLDISESDPLPQKPLTQYAKTKLIAEGELLAQAEQGLQTIVLRPRAVLGFYDKTILPRILRLSEKKNFPLINGGEALTDITCVDNVTGMVRKCLDAGNDEWNNVYNVSNGDPVRMRDLFSGVLEALDLPFRPKHVPEIAALAVAGVMEVASSLPFGPRKPSMTRFSVGYMAKSMTMSIEKARIKLGYEPSIGNRETFRKLPTLQGSRTGPARS